MPFLHMLCDYSYCVTTAAVWLQLLCSDAYSAKATFEYVGGAGVAGMPERAVEDR